jgi:hypothetical protein
VVLGGEGPDAAGLGGLTGELTGGPECGEDSRTVYPVRVELDGARRETVWLERGEFALETVEHGSETRSMQGEEKIS